MDKSNAVLYENGVPLTSDEWSFVDNRKIQKASQPEINGSYTLQSNRLTRFTTDLIDLGVDYASYIWFADSHVWLRPEIIPSDINMSAQLIFDGNGNAKLPMPSNGNKYAATITEENGTSVRTVPVTSWSFRSLNTVNMSLGELNRQSIYSIEYTARSVVSSTQARVQLEIRSSETEDVDTQPWREVQANDIIDNTKRYHQMRVTIYNIRDTRDVRVHSLVLKGLNMYGSGATVPVLRPS
jgi:hypothetical protein